MKTKKLRLAFPLLCLLFCSGCGGGGGSDKETGPSFKATMAELEISRLDSGEAVESDGVNTVKGVTIILEN